MYYTLMRPASCCWAGRGSWAAKISQDISGPVLVVCNHIDDVDVGFVQTALPARLRHWLATATGGRGARSAQNS